MKALSLRQPWAWLILNAGKDIENREWPTKFRGRFLIHAAKGMTRDEYEEAEDFACSVTVKAGELPNFEEIERGGIVGSAELVMCADHSNSPWFFGRYGFVLRDPKPLQFIPYKGRLGFFDVPDEVLNATPSTKATKGE